LKHRGIISDGIHIVSLPNSL